MALLYLGMILLVFILIIGFPIFLSVILYRYLKKRQKKKWLKWLALIPALCLGYFLYAAVFPGDDFYRADYTEVTGLQFPKDAKVISKTASFPDQFGDYTSVFVIKTSKQNYLNIYNYLKIKGFKSIEDNRYSPETKGQLGFSALKVKTGLNYVEHNGKDFYVAFLSDSCSILVRRISW